MEKRKPNIIVILADDLGWKDATCYGSTYFETPNIDKLASQGVRFTEGYAAAPICSPTRASILTGKNPDRTGITSPWCHEPKQDPFLPETSDSFHKMRLPQPRTYLPDSEYTLAEAMRDGGYRTVFIGKWHLGLPPHDPEHNGFEANIGGKSWGGPKSYFSPYGNSKLKDGPEGEYLTDRLAKEASQYLQNNKDKPFFMCLWTYAVHGPWQAKKEYIEYFRKKKDPQGLQKCAVMGAMIKSLDEAVGTVMDTLDKEGLSGNTLVIFLGDNGPVVCHNVDGEPVSNTYPLRGEKAMMYEGGTRVPFIVRWPGHVKPGTTDTETVIMSTDIYTTVLKAAGIEPKAGQAPDAVDLTPILEGTGKLNRKAVFFHYPEGHTYLSPDEDGASIYAPGSSVRCGKWKLIRFYETSTKNYPNRFELYNLAEDISESNNLAEQFPDKVQELNAMLDDYFQDTAALLPQPNPAYDSKYDYLYEH